MTCSHCSQLNYIQQVKFSNIFIFWLDGGFFHDAGSAFFFRDCYL